MKRSISILITAAIIPFTFSSCAGALDGKEVTVSHGSGGTSLTVKVQK